MSKGQLVYSGKAKELYSTSEPDVLQVVYLDQATALNGLRKDQISGKGQLNNQITSLVFEYLSEQGIDNHFIKALSPNEQLVKKIKMIPLEVVVRNVATGSFVKKFAAVEGTVLAPLIEFYYKNDALDDPLMNDAHVEVLGLATAEQVAQIKEQTLALNQALITLFKSIELTLVDFKVEYGLTSSGEILLADEITPDTCRLWDLKTGKSLDKDVYRKETGDLIGVYEEVLRRLERALTKNN
ncbi:phosphoribosylaminoimidazolesuccinocarboxamide synthase [Vagococcus sp. BWB3-3]|uniref:Phosphoribosylaminoimidazole-succinocarboxamide synthase n=1 Tax=Vagococcus allomyrinae TaxID=2794353 RepID=A0A940PER5_9ENTE|nr:phosphoribosylaminoimidazolesuccinocarboxamide synthase [Vagococcus allomyrinae]